MLALLCPDLPEAVLERILPSKRNLLSVLSSQAGSRAQHLQALTPIEDVLFSGLVYELAGQEQVDSRSNGTSSFLESF